MALDTLKTSDRLATSMPENLQSSASWLCCEVGGQQLAVPTSAVREVIRGRGCSPLPLTPAWVRGLTSLRGSPLVVFDLAERLGLRAGVVGHRSSVLVVQSGVSLKAASSITKPAVSADGDQLGSLRQPMGLWVDRVLEIVYIDSQSANAVPLFGNAVPSRFVARVLRRNGQVVLGLALEQVLHTEQLARAMADHAAGACAQAMRIGTIRTIESPVL